MGEGSARVRRWLVGIVIVTFWAAMTAWLVHREVLPTLRGTRLAQVPVEPRERWYGLFVEDRRLGTIHVAERPESRGGVDGSLVHVTASIALSLAGEVGRVQLAGSLWRPLGTDGVQLEGAVTSGDHELRVRAAIANDVLQGVLLSGGEEIPLRTPVDPALFRAGASPLGTPLPALSAGEATILPGFDPLTLRPSRVRLRSLPRGDWPPDSPREAERALRVTAGTTSFLAFTDAAGEIVEARTPFGLTLRRSSREASLAGSPAAADLLARSLVVPRGARPFRGARRMVVRLSGVEAVIPEDDSQLRLRSGAYRIVQQRPLATGSTTTSPGYLGAEPLVQADHPRIRGQANAIVGDATEGWERVRRLVRWVHEELDKRAVLSLPSALAVLANREGDCNEHTVLFTALARAAGIPCRMAVGIVWSEELEAFGYHAWPEVWVGRWVRVDPTFGQEVADATHVKLVDGGIERWGQVLAYLGALEVEVVDVE